MTMKRKPKYDHVLFVALMTLLLLPLVQGWLGWVNVKPLAGVTYEAKRPSWTWANYRSGDLAQEAEVYASEHYGFREVSIRLYNQYLWTCYKKTYAHDVVAGKHGWLFYPQSVDDYYGHELLRWHNSTDEARRRFDMEVKYMNWARSILKENGIELMMFMAPEKGQLYPEHLPDGEKDTTTFNACDYFAQRFEETGFPYIEMTRWFQQMKDTVSYPLIPQTGAHWVFPCVYAADSLFRYIGELNGTRLPQIQLGPLHEVKNHAIDNDIEHLLNLVFPLRHQYGFSPRAKVSIVADSLCSKPKVLLVGNSFFWAFNTYLPLDEVFDETEFWFYGATAYYGDSLHLTANVNDLNLLEKLLHFDDVVWFTTGNQMSKGTSGFAEKAIVSLCYSDEAIGKVYDHLMDSLKHDGVTMASFDEPIDDSTCHRQLWVQANKLIYSHPERYFPELLADSLPAIRNPRIKEILTIQEIEADSVWLWKLAEYQTVIQNATLEQVLLIEARNRIDGRPLLRDMPDPEAKRDRVEQLVKEMIEEIKPQTELMERIRTMAQEKGITIEKQTELAARWIVNDKINQGIIVL